MPCRASEKMFGGTPSRGTPKLWLSMLLAFSSSVICAMRALARTVASSVGSHHLDAALSFASSAAQVGSVSTARQTGRVWKMSPQQPPTPDWMEPVDELKDQIEPAFGCGGCTPGGECGLHSPSSTPGPTE